eukprot:4589346-Pleurochrysis_carterae.AAC.1
MRCSAGSPPRSRLDFMASVWFNARECEPEDIRESHRASEGIRRYQTVSNGVSAVGMNVDCGGHERKVQSRGYSAIFADGDCNCDL